MTIVMETNIEQRSAIKFCWKAGKTGTETYKLLQKAYGEECVYHVQPRSYGSASFKTVVKTYTTTNRQGVPAPAGQTTTS